MGWMIAVVLAAFLAAMALGIYMWAVEPRWFRTWRVTVPARPQRSADEISLRPGCLPSLRILHVSDTHFGIDDASKLDFLHRVAEESVDFVFFTGDIIETEKGISPCRQFVEALSPRFGTYAVLGGHDYYHSGKLVDKYTTLAKSSREPFRDATPNPTRKLKKMLCSSGVDVLADENRLVELPQGKQFRLIGLRDAYVFPCDYQRAWDGVPGNSSTLVLAHSPDVLPEIVRRNVDLAFFGHTHGGQVRFPLVGALVTRSHLKGSRARGVFREGETIFTLNRGVGAGKRSNFRLLCRPEITFFDITS